MRETKYGLHLLCWALFISYELGLLYYSIGRLEPWYVSLVFYTLNIGFFYGHVAILDRTFGRKVPAYFTGLLLWLGLLLSYLLLKRLADYLFYAYPVAPVSTFKILLANYLFRAVYYAILSTFYWSSGYIARYKKRAADAERQQLITEKEKAGIQNAYLRQQISPHLLFNTLNFIYSDVYKSSPAAGRSVLLLSDVIRFGLEPLGPDGKVLLSRELEHIGKLLEINRSRFQEGLQLELAVYGDPGSLRIIPLVLLTLTENVIKHGNLTEPASPGKVRIGISAEGRLNYHSRNLKKSKNGLPVSSRLGMQNIRLRLDYTYTGAYTLDIREGESEYELNLDLQL